jgi:hypothetical protein
MPELDPHFVERLASLTDDALLAIARTAHDQFTPEALAFVNEEVLRRGGLDALSERVSAAEKQNAPNDETVRLKRFLLVAVIAACGLFILALNGSSWFYWICLFALIAALFAVLFNPPVNPEIEVKDLLLKAKEEGSSPAATGVSSDEQPRADQAAGV